MLSTFVSILYINIVETIGKFLLCVHLMWLLLSAVYFLFHFFPFLLVTPFIFIELLSVSFLSAFFISTFIFSSSLSSFLLFLRLSELLNLESGQAWQMKDAFIFLINYFILESVNKTPTVSFVTWGYQMLWTFFFFRYVQKCFQLVMFSRLF